MPKNKKILITGASGFVGANLTMYFCGLGYDIHALVRLKSSTNRLQHILKNICLHQADLGNARRLKTVVKKIKPNYILHTAAFGGYPGQVDSRKSIDVNFIGTVNLFNACADIDFDLFINSGSSSEYGLKKQKMRETDYLEPITAYGVSKAAGTLYLQSLSLRDNRPITTLRLFSPYGYYDGISRLIPSVILSCLKGQQPRLASSRNVRDFIFIEDVLSAYEKTIRNAALAKSNIINIGSGVQRSSMEVVSLIMRLCGSRVNPVWDVIKNTRIEPVHWQADISKAKQIIDWQPRFSLENGLARTIKWYKENESF